MIAGVSFDELHCYNDLGIILAEKKIGIPEPWTTFIDVPGRDGPIDLTESMTGEVHYKERPIELKFVTNTVISEQSWSDLLSNVSNAIHGLRKKIVFDDDPNWYYMGRCEINEFETKRSKRTIKVECTCDPFKKDANGNTSL